MVVLWGGLGYYLWRWGVSVFVIGERGVVVVDDVEDVGVEGGVEPGLEDVLGLLSERGRLEWELAYQRALIALLRG